VLHGLGGALVDTQIFDVGRALNLSERVFIGAMSRTLSLAVKKLVLA